MCNNQYTNGPWLCKAGTWYWTRTSIIHLVRMTADLSHQPGIGRNPQRIRIRFEAGPILGVCGWNRTITAILKGPKCDLIKFNDILANEFSADSQPRQCHLQRRGFHYTTQTGSPGWARTNDIRINSATLYRLSYWGIVWSFQILSMIGRTNRHGSEVYSEF